MNSRLMIVAGLLVASSTVALAQDTPVQSETKPADATPAEAAPAPADPAPAAKGAQSTADISLAELAVCLGVEERTPVGEAEQFSSDVGKLWCFTKVLNADAPTQVFHRWYVGDRLVNEIPINVGASHWRCWSAKTIQPSWTGTCRVEILTESGDVIGTQEFQLSPGASSSSEG
ncbi:MAG: hypothetical protein DHS20C21_18690 [Gemmatimonadota bacterium]|nr:MAG: hypothetical protein DHS20C21_18690 [Gemmatimonadota bacterium]